MIKCELFHDNFQNFKQYNIPNKAQTAAIPDFKEEPYTGKLPWD